MRWLVLTDDALPSPGGVAVWTASVVRGLCEAGDEVVVVARERGGLEPGVRGAWGPRFRRWGGLWAWARAWDVSCDRVLATTWRMAWPAVARGVPVDVVFHGSDLTNPSAEMMPVVQRARCWAVSRYLADCAAKRGLAAGVLPAPVDPVPGGDPNGPWLLAGRAVPLKGGDAFVAMCAAAGQTGWVVGDGPALAGWEAQARAMGADVRFFGHRRPSELAALRVSCSAAFLLARQGPHGVGTEGLGLALVEGAAAGLATVGSAVGGIPEAVGPGLVLASPEDAEASVRAFREWWHRGRGGEARTWAAGQHGRLRTVAWLRTDHGTERNPDAAPGRAVYRGPDEARREV